MVPLWGLLLDFGFWPAANGVFLTNLFVLSSPVWPLILAVGLWLPAVVVDAVVALTDEL